MKPTRKERFRYIFQKHYPWLCQIAYGYVRNEKESEDIVQEVFISMWNKGKDNMPEKEFAAYATVCVKNSCISHIRKNRSVTVQIDKSPEAHNIHNPERSEDSALMLKKAEEAVGILPEKCREIFLMNKVEKFKYREISAKLGISEKTVENQMGKAIRLIREYIAANPLAIILITTLTFFINCM